MDYHRADILLIKYLDIETNEKLDLIIEQIRNLMSKIREEGKIKREEILRLKSIEKKKEYFNIIIEQLPKIRAIIDNKEKYDKTREIERLRKYFRTQRRKEMLKSKENFCEYVIMKCKKVKYQSELTLEIEHIKGRF